MKYFLTFISIALMTGCIGPSLEGKDYKILSKEIISDNALELEFTRFKSGTLDTSYFLFLTIKNTSDKEVQFDSAEVELVDETTGVSFYSISKDNTNVALPIFEVNIITQTTIKPGRKITGKILFPTNNEAATAKEMTIHYANQSIKLRQ